MTGPIGTNFIIYRTCYTVLDFNQSACEKLGTKDTDEVTQDIEKKVQPYANIITMTQSALTLIVPSILCLFIGPWSDRNGRKPIMIFTILGFIIRGIVTLIVALIDNLSPWYLLLGSIPAALFGGIAPLMMAVICYITDVTTEENRGFRMGMVDAMMALGMLLGTLCSSFVFEAGGYVLIYGLDLLMNILSCLFARFVIKESVPPNLDDEPIFAFENIKNMLRATFRRRENYGRAILLTTFCVSTISIFAFTADSSVLFLFLREKLHWDLEHYTLYSSVSSLTSIVGTFVGVGLLNKLLKIPETPLLIVGCLSYLGSSMLLGFAIKDWYIYAAAGIRSLYGIINPMGRSLISKLLSKEETGKVFAIAVTLDSVIAVIGGPVYTIIYNNTIDTNAGIFNFVSAGMFAIAIVLVM
ncbi:MFS transporter [Holotrichia oblita]|uniref:MFS transporter n=2 Tax=Holotrichia oblita TaxID=644536 RepID=A0ACB9TII8_HOLOL|nr:MFS transporter [Holotrichia oblita]KAI4466631.1 MFS transporter [Holotrichia oblita]